MFKGFPEETIRFFLELRYHNDAEFFNANRDTYETYVRKARRVDARSAVLDMAARQERYFSVHNKYTQTAGDLGYSALPQAVGNGGSSFYQLSVTGDEQTYTAKATPTGVLIKDGECYAYTVNQRGLRGNQDAGGNTLNAGNCW